QGARHRQVHPGAGARPDPGRGAGRPAVGVRRRRLRAAPDRRRRGGRTDPGADRHAGDGRADAPAGDQPARRGGRGQLRARARGGPRRPRGARAPARALEGVQGARNRTQQARHVMTLATGYDPTSFESRLYAKWEASGLFQPSGQGEPYVILLPPPNVTGTLHMGHAFQQTLMDALVRYHRMRGFDTLWQVGTDHAGIATEMVVSRNLALEGKGETRDSLGRDAFIERVWEWKGQSGDTIERQMRRLGTSADWSRSVFTMDPMAADAVVEAFVRLHEEGLIYRGQRLVNWDPVLKTAISDLEVVNEEEDGHLWSISYPLADGSGALTVATTRPETMLGDTALMVHPEDERYAHLVGQRVRLPLSEREIPVIADAYVDREFGTGVVQVTPAHDFNDYQVGVRHALPLINVLTADAKINDNAPAKYRGLDRYDARKAVLADLEAAGLLVETKPHKLQVPRGDRTGQVIEPWLTD